MSEDKQKVTDSEESDIPNEKKIFWTGKKLAALAAVLFLVLVALWFLHPHSYGEWTVTKEATCTATGVRERKCFCGELETEIMPKKKHTLVTISGKVATCLEDGLTEGNRCANCDYIAVAQKAIPALGHSFSNNDCVRCDAKEWWVEFTTTRKEFAVGERIQIDFDLKTYEVAGKSTRALPFNFNILPAPVEPGESTVPTIYMYNKVYYEYADGSTRWSDEDYFNDGKAVKAETGWLVYWEKGVSKKAKVTLYIYDGDNHVLGSYTFQVE